MLSVIIPCYNEPNIVANITEVKETLRGIDYEIIIIDDHSTPQVKDIPGEQIFIHRNDRNMGKGKSLRIGLRIAQGDMVAFLDGDLQIHPHEIHTFLRLMELYDADAVVGSKRHPYSNVRYSLKRWVVSNTYNFMVRQMFGISLRDTQCGLKLFKSSALLHMLMRIDRYAADLELIVELKEKGYRVVDAPVNVYQSLGQGSVSLKNIIDTFIDTVKIWINKKRGIYGSFGIHNNSQNS